MSLNDKASAALRRELAKCFPERAENDPGHGRLAAALSDTARRWTMERAYNELGTQHMAFGNKSTEIHNNGTAIGVWIDFENAPHGPNARLIATAPELLELLAESLMYVEECEQFHKPECRTLSKRIRAAIARAEGGAA